MSYVGQKVGEAAIFLLPSLKLKKRSTGGVLVEEEVHRFLMEHFGGYTAAAGNIFGYWVEPGGGVSYGEHRQFMVALDRDDKIVSGRQLLDQIDVQRLHEPHVCDRGIERLRSLQRGLHHRAKREDGYLLAPPAHLALTHG